MLTCTVVLESCRGRFVQYSTTSMRAEAIVSLHKHVQSEGSSLPLDPSRSRSEKAHYAQGARYVVDLGLTKILLHNKEHV
jgi:hypothetical protein